MDKYQLWVKDNETVPEGSYGLRENDWKLFSEYSDVTSLYKAREFFYHEHREGLSKITKTLNLEVREVSEYETKSCEDVPDRD